MEMTGYVMAFRADGLLNMLTNNWYDSALTTVEEIEAYDYTTGYQEKLQF